MRQMQIETVELPLARPFAISRGTRTAVTVVRVTLEERGFIGRGECTPTAHYQETPESVVRQLETVRDAVERGVSLTDLQSLLPPGAARNAIDCALWRLNAALNKQTLWQHLAIQSPQSVITAETLSLDTLENMPFGVFSVGGFNRPSDLILPALTLGASVAAVMARFTRSAFMEVMQEDFVRTAKAKGLRNRLIVWKHVMRNALIPVITMLGLQFGFLLGGSIVVESVFSWPGLGWLLIESIKTQDQPVIQALVMLFVFEFILINLLVDLLYAVVNPAIRLR